MNTPPPASTSEALHQVNDRCEEVLQRLGDLLAIHRELDARTDWHVDGEFADRAMLRKASLHVQAVASWQMDGDVLHVMAPEIRAATAALDPLVQESLPDSLAAGSRSRHSFLASEGELNSFAHPTIASLALSRGNGGFNNRGYVRYLMLAYFTLISLMVAYAYAVGVVAEGIDSPKAPAILDIITREREAGQALDWEAILRLADD